MSELGRQLRRRVRNRVGRQIVAAARGALVAATTSPATPTAPTFAARFFRRARRARRARRHAVTEDRLVVVLFGGEQLAAVRRELSALALFFVGRRQLFFLVFAG